MTFLLFLKRVLFRQIGCDKNRLPFYFENAKIVHLNKRIIHSVFDSIFIIYI